MIAVLLAIVAAVFVFVVIPNQKYNDAVALMEEGEYEEAITAFVSLGEYKDSASKIVDCETAILDNNYQNAISLMEAGEYSAAYEVFASIKDYEDSEEKLVLCSVEEIKQAEPGDVVLFGAYNQDGDSENGKEPIEWRVLEKKDDKVLLITEQVIIFSCYDTYEKKDKSYFKEFFSD